MKQIAKVRLNPNPEQHAALGETQELGNALCNDISAFAWQNIVSQQSALHKALYHRMRQKYPLPSQIVVRCLARVADAYRVSNERQWVFSPRSPIPFDERSLTWFVAREGISIVTVKHRQRIAYDCSDDSRDLLKFQLGESDLVYLADTQADKPGTFYLLTMCEIPDPDSSQLYEAIREPGDIPF